MTLMKIRLASTRAGVAAMIVAIAGCAVAPVPIAIGEDTLSTNVTVGFDLAQK